MKQQSPEERQDLTVSKLLIHLREMRDVVPVNQKLKQDLKKQLMGQMMQVDQQKYIVQPNTVKKNKKVWFGTVTISLALLLLFVLVLRGDSPSDRKFLPLEGRQPNEIAALSPDGKEFVLIRQHEVWLYNTQGRKLRSILMPGKGIITQILYSPTGKELGVLQQEEGMTTIWYTSLTTGGVQLFWEGSSSKVRGLRWSERGKLVPLE